eukprot:gnl/Carplike_NY0171/1360_a1848_1142.p1 GENE.gnl/Carplike_NY0171/1360_a1848_1142~~gnl/Carplike_NY0171/1360_a1848_1142.p1  ORF type:complete len:208 (+),score=47.67 gnl/Carplike_NY0171/1360_a1848_1142:36-626(+)
MSTQKALKCVAVGDGAVGKTCMLFVYCSNVFPDVYIPTVFDTHKTTVLYHEESINLSLWDTAGQDTYQRFRPITYTDTDVFLVCFSVVRPESFKNITEKWIPEVRHTRPDAAIVLVGTKSDLREDPTTLEELKEKGEVPISEEMAKKLAKSVKAAGYIECSAKESKNIREVFDFAVDAALNPKHKKSSGSGGCLIL